MLDFIKVEQSKTEFGVELGSADAQFSANIRYAKTSLNAFYGVHDLAISEF